MLALTVGDQVAVPFTPSIESFPDELTDVINSGSNANREFKLPSDWKFPLPKSDSGKSRLTLTLTKRDANANRPAFAANFECFRLALEHFFAL